MARLQRASPGARRATPSTNCRSAGAGATRGRRDLDLQRRAVRTFPAIVCRAAANIGPARTGSIPLRDFTRLGCSSSVAWVLGLVLFDRQCSAGKPFDLS